MTDFIYLECRLRDALGISDGLIKKTRKKVLVGGGDFRQVDGRIAYTAEGVASVVLYLRGDKVAEKTREKAEAVRMTELLAAALISPVPSEKQGGSSEGVADEVATPLQRLLGVPWEVPDCEMKFHKCPKNARILQGRISEEWIKEHGYDFFNRHGVDPRMPQRIRVKDNSKFTDRMIIPCRWVQADLWQCTKRMPKGRGRW